MGIKTESPSSKFTLRLLNAFINYIFIHLILRDVDKSTMNMIPENIFMESDTVLVQYIIKSWTLQLRNTSDTNQGIELVLVLKRRIINEMLTTYLPSILILSIVYATNFFK